MNLLYHQSKARMHQIENLSKLSYCSHHVVHTILSRCRSISVQLPVDVLGIITV